MKPALSLLATPLLATACFHHSPPSIENDPTAVAAVRADVRVVNGDTTWVTRGVGYELVGRSKRDLVLFQPQLDREAAVLQKVFPGDTLARVVATVRRATPEGKPFIAAAPVPTTVRGMVVELVVPDPKAHQDQPQDGRPNLAAIETARVGMIGSGAAILPVVRAWLSARASAITGKSAPVLQATGEVDDARVPEWAQEMLPALIADSIVDRVTLTLAGMQERLIPLSEYFTETRLSLGSGQIAQRGGRETRPGAPGGAGGAGGRGGMGGAGGRGGMGGGGRGGMGRGGGGMGRGGGGGNRGGGEGERVTPLAPPVMFAAQSLVFGRYLARQGYDLIGQLVDAQIRGGAVADVLLRRGIQSVAWMDEDWRTWLAERGNLLSRE